MGKCKVDSLMVRKKMNLIIISVVLVLIIVGYYGWKFTARNAYESAEYTVLDSESPFEIREYPDLMLVTTNMQFDSQGDDGSFMRLFRYIDGANNDEQKVAMTTPVFMEADEPDEPGQMGFVVPKEVMEQHIPEPSNEKVQVQKRDGGRFAVIRFDGRLNNKSVAEAEEKLNNWINEKGLTRDGDAEYAGYDPPWTPGPFRRNEVLVRVK